jgi:hypothetical protein
MSESFIYRCEMDLGLTYAMSRPDVAYSCFIRCMLAAIRMGRPDLGAQANELLSIVGV